MPTLSTAIIHLHDRPAPEIEAGPQLRRMRGVREVTVDPKDRVIAVQFDHAMASVADLVRAVEDGGTTVAGVAQRGD